MSIHESSTRYDPQRIVEMQDGRLWYKLPLKGVYKDKDGWHIKEGLAQDKIVHFGNQWDGLEFYKKGQYTRKQRRAFMRLNTGLGYGISKRQRLVFLTLTTKYDKENKSIVQKYQYELNRAFTIFKKRLIRYIRKMIYEQYCRVHNLIPYEKRRGVQAIKYQGVFNRQCRFAFQYFKVRTAEGGGVLHIMFRKDYNTPKIDKNWIHKNWANIWHGSWNTSIYQIPYSDSKKTSAYIIRGYVQNQPVLRMSYGQQWVYPGFRKSLIHLIEVYGFKRALEIWKQKMKYHILPTIAGTRQLKFGWEKLFSNRKYPAKYYHRNVRIGEPPKRLCLGRIYKKLKWNQAEIAMKNNRLFLKKYVGVGYSLLPLS